jgi:hypothetical protein
MTLPKIGVVDGQGGGIGAAIVKKVKAVFGESVEIIALGTNAIATAQMLKAKANRGASGENAIVQTVAKLDVIAGPLSIVLAQAMLGEVTPSIATAVAASPAPKLLIPLTQENVTVIGLSPSPLPHLVEIMVEENLSQLLGRLICTTKTIET